MDIVGQNTLETMKKARWYNEWLLSHFKKNIKGDILEAGGGTGTFTNYLAECGNVTTIDINPDYFPLLKKTNAVNSGKGDIEKGSYFFKNKRFDTIVSLNVIEHIKDDSKAIENIYKLLLPKGKFIMLVPAHQMLFSKFDTALGHYRRYTKKEVSQKLTQTGFWVEDCHYLNWWAAVGWFVFMMLLRKKTLSRDSVGLFDKLAPVFLYPEKLIHPPFGLSVLAVAQKP